MLSQIHQDPHLVDAIRRMKGDPDFKRIISYLEENLPNIAKQSVYSVGEAKYELSGSYKLLEELLGILGLEELKDRPEATAPRWA